MTSAEHYYNRLALHYSACNESYYKGQDCEREYPIRRAFGKCTQYFVDLHKCIKRERSRQLEANNRKAAERHKKYKARFAEIEALKILQ